MNYILNRSKMFIVASVILIASSCSELLHDDHDHEGQADHIEAKGFALENEAGEEVFRQLNGTITGSISIDVDEVLELTVHLLDADGNELEHEEHEEEGDDHDHEDHEEEEVSLAITVANTAIVTVEVEEHEEGEDHDEEHEMALIFTGISSGTTTFVLQVMHGDHSDYSSLDNSIVVN